MRYTALAILTLCVAMLLSRTAVVSFRVSLTSSRVRNGGRNVLSTLSSLGEAEDGKRLARIRTKAEVKLRNQRYREASTQAASDPKSLTAVRVSVCPKLREEVSRGPMHIT